MNTVEHGFWVYFITRKHNRVWQYVFGAMFPDLIYFGGFLYLLSAGQIPLHAYTFWNNPAVGISFMRSLPWVGFIEFAAHSAVVWLVVYAASFVPVMRKSRAFILGWGSHLLIDALTHVEYAPYFLYPLSWVQFPIGVSYWDNRYHSTEFQWVQSILNGLAILYLIYEYYARRRL